MSLLLDAAVVTQRRPLLPSRLVRVRHWLSVAGYLSLLGLLIRLFPVLSVLNDRGLVLREFTWLPVLFTALLLCYCVSLLLLWGLYATTKSKR